MIEVHIYEKETGLYKYTDIGNPDHSIATLPDNLDFTLSPLLLSSDKQQRWDGSKWQEVLPPPEPLEVRRERVWGAIKNRRYEVITSGVYVASVGKVFHTDEVSAIQYNNIGNMIALGNYEPVDWKVMDNTWLTLTESLFKELQAAMAAKTRKAYRIAEWHKTRMLESDDPEDYDYSTDWGSD